MELILRVLLVKLSIHLVFYCNACSSIENTRIRRAFYASCLFMEIYKGNKFNIRSSLQTFIINNTSTSDARVLGLGAHSPSIFLPLREEFTTCSFA
jgi:hypothetical protein